MPNMLSPPSSPPPPLSSSCALRRHASSSRTSSSIIAVTVVAAVVFVAHFVVAVVTDGRVISRGGSNVIRGGGGVAAMTSCRCPTVTLDEMEQREKKKKKKKKKNLAKCFLRLWGVELGGGREVGRITDVRPTHATAKLGLTLARGMHGMVPMQPQMGKNPCDNPAVFRLGGAKGRQGTLGTCQAKFRLSTYEGSDVMVQEKVRYPEAEAVCAAVVRREELGPSLHDGVLELRGHSGWVADELSLGICQSTTDGKAVCCDELSLLVLSAALVGPPPSFEPSALGKDVIAATEGPAGERASIAGGTKEWHVRARGAAGSDGESMMNVRGTASGERKRRGIARGKAGGTRGVACWGTRHKWGVRSPTEMKGGANKGRHALWIKISRVQRIMVVQVIQANTNQTAVWKHEHEFVNTTTMRDNYPLQKIRRPWWEKTCGGGKEVT
ncbi:hypothetical protein EDB84DRAFT_1440948 [Lactarius hengduanensis]|nr:hypothetical protein EDB84DRAFT_1440948 [Lactarius hengduanensis]